MYKFNEKTSQPMEQSSDEVLCSLAAQGSRAAEELLVTRYNRLVRSCARPYFLVGGDSEDLTQEGMVGLLKAVREYDASKEASFRTFAEICIRNRLYSVLRAAARDKHLALNQSVPLDPPFFDGNPYASVPAIWLSAIPKRISSTGNTPLPSYPVFGNSCPSLKQRFWGTI